jgi:4-hydroxy-3-methylbut-2-enyl diphosphate reductase
LAALCAEQVTTYHIADPDEINVDGNAVRVRRVGPHHHEDEVVNWLPIDGPLRIGITAGASTPNNKIGQAVARVFAIRGEQVDTSR